MLNNSGLQYNRSTCVDCVVFAGARDGKPFTIQLHPYASTDSLPKAYTWSVSQTVDCCCICLSHFQQLSFFIHQLMVQNNNKSRY